MRPRFEGSQWPLARFMLAALYVRLMELGSMKFNPYAVLLTTGVLMLAIVIAAQTGPTVSMIKAKVAASHAPTSAPTQAETHLASVDRPSDRRTLED